MLSDHFAVDRTMKACSKYEHLSFWRGRLPTGRRRMDHHDIHALRILEEIEKDGCLSQRELSRKLNISLGLVNSFIKRLAQKGFFKITTIPRNRVAYMLTPKGFAEKTRLTYEFIQYSFRFYKRARRELKTLLGTLESEGVRKVIFYGAGDLAEIAYVSLKETRLDLVAVVDDFKAGEIFLGVTVVSPPVLKQIEYDRIIITSICSKNAIFENLARLDIPRGAISWLE